MVGRRSDITTRGEIDRGCRVVLFFCLSQSNEDVTNKKKGQGKEEKQVTKGGWIVREEESE